MSFQAHRDLLRDSQNGTIMRAITMSSLSAVACLLVLTCPLVSGAAHGGVNDVIPVRDSQFCKYSTQSL